MKIELGFGVSIEKTEEAFVISGEKEELRLTNKGNWYRLNKFNNQLNKHRRNI